MGMKVVSPQTSRSNQARSTYSTRHTHVHTYIQTYMHHITFTVTYEVEACAFPSLFRARAQGLRLHALRLHANVHGVCLIVCLIVCI